MCIVTALLGSLSSQMCLLLTQVGLVFGTGILLDGETVALILDLTLLAPLEGVSASCTLPTPGPACPSGCGDSVPSCLLSSSRGNA